MKIAILSDIHANLPALEVVLGDVERNKCDHIFVLGDLIGYYHWPKEVVEKIMSLSNCTTIKGNHEDLLLGSLNSKDFANRCKDKYGTGLELAAKILSEVELQWLKELPDSKTIILEDVKFSLVHGSDKDINEYIYPDSHRERIDSFDSNTSKYVFFGHTHYPVIFNRGQTTIANPGSVGQPRDIGSLASYLILNTTNGALLPRRLPFDSDRVRAKVLEHDPSYTYLIEILKRNNSYA